MSQVQLRLEANPGPLFPGPLWRERRPTLHLGRLGNSCHVVWGFGSPWASRGPHIPHPSHWQGKGVGNAALAEKGPCCLAGFLQVVVLFGFIDVHLFFPPTLDTM